MNLREDAYSNSDESLPQLLKNVSVRGSTQVDSKISRGSGLQGMAAIRSSNITPLKPQENSTSDMPYSHSTKALVKTQESQDMLGRMRNDLMFRSIDQVNVGKRSQSRYNREDDVTKANTPASHMPGTNSSIKLPGINQSASNNKTDSNSMADPAASRLGSRIN